MLSFESSRYQELSDSEYAGLYSNESPWELVDAIRNYITDK
jgi:family 8 glycosyl transferase